MRSVGSILHTFAGSIIVIGLGAAGCGPGTRTAEGGFDFPRVREEARPIVILGPAGEVFEFIRTGASTCGKYLLSRTTVPPGAGPLPHIHHWTDEWFFAPAGGITLFMGRTMYPDLDVVPGAGTDKDLIDATVMDPGRLVYGPRYFVHGFTNNTSQARTLYLVWTPDTSEISILGYFKRVGQVLDDKDHVPPVDPLAKVRYVSEAPSFGINQSDDFWQYVKSVEQSTMNMVDRRDELLALLEAGEASCPEPAKQ